MGEVMVMVDKDMLDAIGQNQNGNAMISQMQ